MLTAAYDELAKVWTIGEEFEKNRERALAWISRTAGEHPAPEARAALANGLLELGHRDDALLAAAAAINLGEAADINTVGASALEVLFDAGPKRDDFLEHLRSLLQRL